jgi:hypothetical protein
LCLVSQRREACLRLQWSNRSRVTGRSFALIGFNPIGAVPCYVHRITGPLASESISWAVWGASGHAASRGLSSLGSVPGVGVGTKASCD